MSTENEKKGLECLSDECLAQIIEASSLDACNEEKSLSAIAEAAFEELSRRS